MTRNQLTTKEIADDILESIKFSVKAHAHNPKKPDDSVRFWDMNTPYIVHPIWCAMTIMTETTLPDDVRLNGCKALLWHDVLEDTLLPLPKDTSEEVSFLVNQMTFESFAQEKEAVWNKEPVIRLYKLYDKVSNMLDSSWMKPEKWNDYAEFTMKLAVDVEKNYGQLNIIKIANAICVP